MGTPKDAFAWHLRIIDRPSPHKQDPAGGAEPRLSGISPRENEIATSSHL